MAMPSKESSVYRDGHIGVVIWGYSHIRVVIWG